MAPRKLKALLRADPFVPFRLVLPSGRTVGVDDPDHVAFDGGRTLTVFTDAGDFVRVEVGRTMLAPVGSGGVMLHPAKGILAVAGALLTYGAALCLRGREPLVSVHPIEQSLFQNVYGAAVYVVGAAFCFKYVFRKPAGAGKGERD